MPITGHTWSVAERKAAKSFARSLGETRLQFARELTNRPTASAEDVVEILVQQMREPAWVAGYFDVKKPDIIKFFRNQRPVKADLRLTSLSKVRIFLSEQWGQFSKANFGEGSDEDFVDYDMQTCQLCILWAWANM